MQIHFNESQIQTQESANLLQLLVQQQLADKHGIAVAVNNEVIPRSKWHEYILQPEEKIVVFTAAQGG